MLTLCGRRRGECNGLGMTALIGDPQGDKQMLPTCGGMGDGNGGSGDGDLCPGRIGPDDDGSLFCQGAWSF